MPAHHKQTFNSLVRAGPLSFSQPCSLPLQREQGAQNQGYTPRTSVLVHHAYMSLLHPALVTTPHLLNSRKTLLSVLTSAFIKAGEALRAARD